jgi:hypothetical protein
MVSLDTKLNEALAQLQHHENVIVTLKGELHKARLFVAQVELEGRIATLPTESKERLRKAFPGTDMGGLKQAVNVEKRRGVK